jgi:hypothetical protein
MRRPIVFLFCLIAAGCFGPAADRHDPVAPQGIAVASQSPRTTVLHVDAGAAPDGDGSGRAPFRTINAAVTRANAIGGARINVAPGQYSVGETVRIESPIILHGSNEPVLDADGLPTGVVAAGTETRITGSPALGANTMFVIGRAEGADLEHVSISNVTIQGGSLLASSILILRTQDFAIRDNVMYGPTLFGINTFASSGEIRGNHISNVACGSCIGAGNVESPSVVSVKGNRMIGNRNGGVLLNGSGTDLEEMADQLDATVDGNDLSDNQAANGIAFGLRIFFIRRDPLTNPQFTGHVRAVVRNNRLANNNIGVEIDAGFPYRRLAGVCDPRTYSGTVDATFRGNVVSGSTLTPALFSFTRSILATNPAMAPLWQYLHDSRISITDPDGSLAGYWKTHPANDPIVGTCTNDASMEPLNNRLSYNGVAVGTGTNTP